jgi:hypothetical protein
MKSHHHRKAAAVSKPAAAEGRMKFRCDSSPQSSQRQREYARESPVVVAKNSVPNRKPDGVILHQKIGSD